MSFEWDTEEPLGVPTFESNPDAPGVRIWDPIDKGSFVFLTPSPVSLRPGETEDFVVPLDSAVEFRTSELEIPERIDFNVWNSPEGVSEQVFPSGDGWQSSEPVEYLELPSTAVKIYIRVGCDLTIRERDGSMCVELDAERTISIGCRSLNESPAGTITVTDDIEDVMRAVSLFGSALKTLSPERSFPSLRGHPPLIERGEEFSVPSHITRPDSEVRLVLPPERRYVYAATSLAYYLGAEVVPGDTPRLETPVGEYSLAGGGGFDGFEAEVSRVFQHVFFFDCVIREEGFYDVPVYERQQVEPLVEFDFADLYAKSLPEQLDAYLSVPFDAIEAVLPPWHLTMDIVPSAENADVLPFVADELPLIRCPTPTTASRVEAQPTEITDFCRSPRTETSEPLETRPVSPEPVETIEHVWVGDGVPMGSNKATVESYRRRVDSETSNRSTIHVQIVCNDPMMKAEGTVRERYQFGDSTCHEVDIAYDVTTDELRSLFATEVDFLHYIGHVNHDGIECVDGVLDTRTLDTVNVESFLLNACRSYEQGATLVEKGSRAGVATLSEVPNEPATKMGCLLARGLGSALSFRTALSIAQSQTLLGDRYVTIGDGGMCLCLPFSGTTSMVHIEDIRDGIYTVRLKPYRTPRYSAGSMSGSIWDDDAKLYLAPKSHTTFEMTADEFEAGVCEQSMPIEYEGELYWSEDITAADLH
ncbi:hypothetical protein [Haladaptatus sp. T7]|uniref:hypothetical protein n=1 Tax=Haladaptatus sp. T7 TaxID=2029368 RepID=UPI0021A2565C|nr:hypothetical protein [Haladaptatus sp. T7]GKZ13719.1 hypothetical protein HAL_16000 [Haladaptatus sp. T7]